MSDKFHQSVSGGPGANHIMLGHGDAIWFSDGKGNSMIPPHNVQVEAARPMPVSWMKSKTRMRPGTNNWYTEDGYGGGSYGSASFGGASYVNCSDTTQPGVAPIVNYLQSLAYPIGPNCEPGHYNLLNNYNPGYFGSKHMRTRMRTTRLHDSAFVCTEHWRQVNCRERLVEVLRRSVEQLFDRSVSAELQRDRRPHR